MLKLENVSVGYGRSSVIYNVDLEVPTGQAVAVMGHNGAGKTTLLRAAVGLLTPNAGTITLDGEDVTRMRPNRRVKRGLGYVPQGQLCFPQMTTLENLQLIRPSRADLDGVLDTFPALKTLLQPAGRPALRRAAPAVGHRPHPVDEPTRMLILDEPTEGIQPNVVTEIEDVIGRLTDRGDLSVLLVEQHVGFALRATDTYYVLEAGRITSQGVGGPGAIDDVRAAMAV